MSLPVRTVSSLLTPLIFVYAIYLVVMGVYSPGGAFAGGVVVGVVACLGVVAQERENDAIVHGRWASTGRSLGFGVIVLFGFLTLLIWGSFLHTGVLLGNGVIGRSPLVVALAFATGTVVGGEMTVAVSVMLEEEVIP